MRVFQSWWGKALSCASIRPVQGFSRGGWQKWPWMHSRIGFSVVLIGLQGV